MSFTKITSSDLANKGVIGLPDVPGLSTSNMQNKLEETARDVIIPKHNGLIDELEAETAAESLGATAPTGMTGNTIQALLNELSEDAHTHSNKSVLDKFSEEDGKPLYNGSAFAGDMLKSVYDNTDAVESAGGIAAYVASAISNKVDKVAGKGLSENDFTNTLKSKLDGIAEGAEVNVQSDWNQSDSSADDFIKNKPSFTQVQSDWNQSTNTEPDYIKNKPTLGTASTLDVPVSGNASTSEVVKGDDTRLTDSRNAADVYSWAKQATKPSYNASEVGAIPSTDKGANGGVAELDSSGKVPSSQLPSYVDDVLEYNSLSDFPATGETGKIYIAKDTNKTYRWSGTAYVEISESLALGETSSTAYAGNKGKANADAISAIKDGTTIDSFGDVETALSNKVDKNGTDSLMTADEHTKLSGIASGAEVNVQSDWNQSSSSADDFIKNKPTLGTAAAKDSTSSISSGSTDLIESGSVYTALSGKQDTLSFDNVPTENSNNPVKSGGVYTALSTKISTEACEQLIEDTVGWTGKNRLKCTLSSIKAINTSGTWSGNKYTINGTEYSITVGDDGDTVEKITVNTPSSSTANANLLLNMAIPLDTGESYIISDGLAEHNSNRYIRIGNATDEFVANTSAGESEFTATATMSAKVYVKNGATVSNLDVYPMIRRADISDSTFEPYHASVDECKADNSVIAPVEDEATASRAYAVGDHSIRDGSFITWQNAKAQDAQINNEDYITEDIATVINKRLNVLFVNSSSNKTTHTLNIPSGRKLLVINGAGATHRAFMAFVYTNSSGVIDILEIVKGTNVTFDGTENNKFKFTYEASGYSYLKIIDMGNSNTINTDYTLS